MSGAGGSSGTDARRDHRAPAPSLHHQPLGRADARDLAIEVIARYQGSALLASTLRDPGLLARESSRVAAWLDTIGA